MKNNLPSSLVRPKKDGILRARASSQLVERVNRMALFLDKDVSDIIRDALRRELQQFEQRSA